MSSEAENGRARRGLASASEETRQRVARKGGIAPHQKRGLAAANPETRMRVAKAGGDARAQDREGLSEAGRRGGEVVKERYGSDFYREIGEKGGGELFGVEGLEVFGLFADADEFDGQAQFFLDGDDHAAFAGAVEFGDDQASECYGFVEFAGLV